MRNLELKVRCESDGHLQAIEVLVRKQGASYMRTMKQRDTYFRISHGRLKLREWWIEGGNEVESSGAELIYYTRPNKAASRISNYDVSPVLEPESIRLILTKAEGALVVVEKVRILYEYGSTRIHLDTVKGLGTFVELETIIGEATSIKDAKAEHQAVITFLGLDFLPPIASSYSDLLKKSSK